MTDKKHLRLAIKEGKEALRLAKSRDVDSHPRLEHEILRVAGNIRHVRVEIQRLPNRVRA